MRQPANCGYCCKKAPALAAVAGVQFPRRKTDERPRYGVRSLPHCPILFCTPLFFFISSRQPGHDHDGPASPTVASESKDWGTQIHANLILHWTPCEARTEPRTTAEGASAQPTAPQRQVSGGNFFLLHVHILYLFFALQF